MRKVLIDDDKMKLELELYENNIPVPHVEIRKGSHNLLKSYFYPIWADLLSQLKEEGHTFVMGMLPSSDYKKIKFLNLMGMHIAAEDGEYVVLRRWL